IKARIDDADALLAASRYDGAIYLCGYAVEVALKFRICKTLRWSGFPSSNNEFKAYQSLKVHNLDVLLTLSGYERRINVNATTFAGWSDIGSWNPESRYQHLGSATPADAMRIVNSAKLLLTNICGTS